MPPDPKVHVGVAGVVLYDDYLLMIQRGGTGAFAGDGHGTWSVPGGWLDFGETPQEAAVREVREETGVAVSAGRDAGFINCIAGSGEFQIVTLFVRCDRLPLSGPAHVTEPDKCPAVEWVPTGEVRDRPLFAPLDAWWPR